MPMSMPTPMPPPMSRSADKLLYGYALSTSARKILHSFLVWGLASLGHHLYYYCCMPENSGFVELNAFGFPYIASI